MQTQKLQEIVPSTPLRFAVMTLLKSFIVI